MTFSHMDLFSVVEDVAAHLQIDLREQGMYMDMPRLHFGVAGSNRFLISEWLPDLPLVSLGINPGGTWFLAEGGEHTQPRHRGFAGGLAGFFGRWAEGAAFCMIERADVLGDDAATAFGVGRTPDPRGLARRLADVDIFMTVRDATPKELAGLWSGRGGAPSRSEGALVLGERVIIGCVAVPSFNPKIIVEPTIRLAADDCYGWNNAVYALKKAVGMAVEREVLAFLRDLWGDRP